MKPTIKISLDTDIGPAIITSTEEFNSIGPYAVAGPGKELAKEWLAGAHEAFGHCVGEHAAPCDLHCAAMSLQEEPEDGVRFVRCEGDIKKYDSDIPEGSCT